jgi:hypothetical protein
MASANLRRAASRDPARIESLTLCFLSLFHPGEQSASSAHRAAKAVLAANPLLLPGHPILLLVLSGRVR